MIEIRKYATRVEAELVKVYLESHDIECQIEADNLSCLNPDMTVGMEVRLLVVNTSDKDQALALLRTTMLNQRKKFPREGKL